jgi:chemotaxis protein MotB
LSRTRHSTSRRRRKHEDHANHEAWAIPYADLLTLLLAFFVVMYAISSVNAGKYRVLSDSLFAAFRGTPRTMQPIQVGEKQLGSGADLNTTVVQQAVLDGKAQSRLAPIPVNVGLQKGGGNARTGPGHLPAQATAAAEALSHVADEVAQAMDQLIQKDMVTIRRNDFWIEVEMRTDILFPSGSARLADDATTIIERLGTVLAPFPNPIRVEGHTDNKPIKTAVFNSNWELSAARAGSVVRVLATHGVSPDRLAVIGYGEQRPIKANDTPEGRNANRRVVVVILSTELMRQAPSNDPATGTAGVAPTATAAPAAGDTANAAAIADPAAAAAITALPPGAVAAPPTAPLTAPAAASPQVTPIAAAPTGAGLQQNTGTETAP